jgi:DNA repair protein RadC
VSETRRGYPSGLEEERTRDGQVSQLSFLAPDDALTLHHLRHLVAEAQRIYRARTGFDPAEAIRLETPADVYRLLAAEMEHLTQEQLHVLTLTTKMHLVGAHLVYQGTVSSSPVRMAEVFRPAIIDAAPSIVVAHNHPSGDPSPSPDDIRLTRQLTASGRLLDIEVMDHIVIAGGRFISMRERGLADFSSPDQPGGGEDV